MPRRPTPHVAAPPDLSARDVRALRAELGVSQAGLGKMLNVSLELVQAWEAERRVPRGAALRLLEIARSNPEVLSATRISAPAARTAARSPAPARVAARAALVGGAGRGGTAAAGGRPSATRPPSHGRTPAAGIASSEGLLRGLIAQGVSFVTVGGVAAQLRGAPGSTDDLDIVYDRAPANLDRLATFLKGIETTLRGAPGTIPFAADPRTLAHTAVLALDTRLGPLDLRQRIAGIGDFSASLSNSSTVALGGRQIPTLTLDAIIVSKRATGRSKDREEVRALEALR